MSVEREFIAVRIAVLTVSDSRSLDQDKSGQTLVDRLFDAGHSLAARAILPDERSEIADQLRTWCADPLIDAVISTGGTGLTGRDVTVEAHRDVYEKEIDAVWHSLYPCLDGKDRNISSSKSRDGRRGSWNLFVCIARITGCLPRRLGRYFGAPTSIIRPQNPVTLLRFFRV